jgi:hypothetical protein
MDSRVARLEEWTEGHEKRCEDRYNGIHATVGEVKGVLTGWRKAVWALVAAIIGFLVVQAYNDLRERPPAPSAVVITPSAPH